MAVISAGGIARPGLMAVLSATGSIAALSEDTRSPLRTLLRSAPIVSSRGGLSSPAEPVLFIPLPWLSSILDSYNYVERGELGTPPNPQQGLRPCTSY